MTGRLACFPPRRARRFSRAILGLLLAALVSCAGDADGDRVGDAADRCPGTPPGQRADADGCCAAQRVYGRAVAALAAADAPRMEVGETWFLQQLARRRPDPALDALLERTRRGLAGHRAARLVDPAAPRLELPADAGHGIMRLANYIFAPVGAPPDRAMAFIDDFTAQPLTGYPLTHQLLVLEWADAVGLALPAPVRERRADLLRRIAAEQRADPTFSDLFAERAAILLAFTTPAADEAAGWIEVIAAAQPADGRWISGRTSFAYDGQSATANHPWVHTTGFVAAAAGYYLATGGRASPATAS
ncbi:MAG: hypothetical protein SF182_07995 [Deltaproteobacteria bacterium]|nr:hypothetical protein [Deltaproteobacteria bacterium]